MRQEDAYRFPRIFIEGLRTSPSLKLLPQGCVEILTSSDGSCGEAIYEEALRSILSLEKQILEKKTCILTPAGEVLVAEKGTKARLQEIKGARIALLVEEGEVVEEGEPVAQVLTGKGEVRTIRAGSSGIVFYIGCLPESQPERCVLVIIDEDGVRRQSLCR